MFGDLALLDVRSSHLLHACHGPAGTREAIRLTVHGERLSPPVNVTDRSASDLQCVCLDGVSFFTEKITVKLLVVGLFREEKH
jgi:hypothetical protein